LELGHSQGIERNTNAGHGRKEIADALRRVIDQPLLATMEFSEGVAAR